MASPYSGIVLNQNSAQTAPTNVLPLTGVFPEYYQTFKLPADYVRGDTASLIPDLTGFQFFAHVSNPTTATLTWRLERQDPVLGWTALANGTSVGAGVAGLTWFNVLCDPVPIDAKWLSGFFRVLIGGTHGLDSVNYSLPSPLLTAAAYRANTTPVLSGTSNVAMMFRVLADVADNGVDFLGNVYRSAVSRQAASNVTPVTIVGDASAWLSQPNPSAFAVASLYFDESQNDEPAVIDRFTLTPLTPGVYFHVYYSNDDAGPGTDPASWDGLLWTPVYKTFQANRRETFALPTPISAKYLKVEFTNLQPRPYNAGPFQVPATYRKYPKWVLDYFLARFASQELDLLSGGIDVTYDLIDLAFSYYRGDLLQHPAPPALATETQQQLQFLNQQATADVIDNNTLAKLDLALAPYLNAPGANANVQSLLGSYTTGASTDNYSTEIITQSLAATSIVSNLQREPLLVEKGFPVMFFFLPCRHSYRVAQALFERNVAYYAGVREIVFHREFYGDGRDRAQYNESLNDGFNAAVNDWLT